jgi:hypothetical protein
MSVRGLKGRLGVFSPHVWRDFRELEIGRLAAVQDYYIVCGVVCHADVVNEVEEV